MNCEQVEILLCDYVDGALDAAGRRELESHLDGCPACAEMARDVRTVSGFLAQVEPVEPPPALITRLVFDAQSRAAAKQEKRGWLSSWLKPVLQPRFVMGMAMTLLSVSMVSRLAGLPQRPLTAADLQPARIWTSIDLKAHRVWDRAVKYYENLRVVYEIQTRLQEWSEQEQEERRSQSQAPVEVTPLATPDGERTESQ
jgi:anti-sigma factor RsiW